ncbi:hypothetical protein FHL15_010704 [Xylaria flabelliformis]|uniref:ZN622/Rei1/Reh1 zinc finger C2H2-type domain-containing protein n=1 Tax=Xylaria flabelliformis TaxID=2512241 RepID=A0A553HKB5_9PEZI|nr:hypothetical protein FHL15_010704 [Xylaria flabelliformis]
MAILASLIGVLCIGIAILYLLNRSPTSLRDTGRLPLPPGPRGFPLVGNVNDFPSSDTFAAKHWLKHKALYGPISSVTIMGQPVILVNDARLAIELCDKRSSKYSSRPRQVFAGEMMGWANSLGLVPYNNLFRAQRKIVHQIIGTNSAASQFNALEEAEVGHFLLHLLESPENLVDHVKTEVGSVTLRIAYGYTAESHKNDPLIDMSTDVMTKFGRAAVPGTYLVDTFPFLRNLPDWFPGTSFKELARQWERELLDVTEKPFTFVKHQMAQGTNKSSFLSQLLEDINSPEDDYAKKWAAGSLYTAGADTDEIDQVITDQSRLPTIADRERMPYVAALTTEIFRWHPAAPMGLPHTSTEDDTCEGYFIPKGSMLLVNIWHFTHDPDTYKDPMEFRPERFLGKDPEPDPLKFVFGFGRRACPGRILAQNTLFLTIAQTLAGFNITKKGKSNPALNFGPGVVSRVAPFECVIKPRSPHHEKLIRSIESIYPWEESDSKVLESMHPQLSKEMDHAALLRSLMDDDFKNNINLSDLQREAVKGQNRSVASEGWVFLGSKSRGIQGYLPTCIAPFDFESAADLSSTQSLLNSSMIVTTTTTTETIPLPTLLMSLPSAPEINSTPSSFKESIDSQNAVMEPFRPGQCLFCPNSSPSFDDSVVHMQKSHGLFVPHQQYLVVDLESLFRYLHLVVFGYRECVHCGTERATVQAVQQHMASKGHCRFDILEQDSEFAEFYDFSQPEIDAESEVENDVEGHGDERNQEEAAIAPDQKTLLADEDSIRLPSGKIISRQSGPSSTQLRRRIWTSASQLNHHVIEAGTEEGPSKDGYNADIPDTRSLSKREKRDKATVTYQLAKMSASDRSSLIHLTPSQQRSILATQHRQTEKVQKEERRRQSRIDRKGNKNLYAYWHTETPVYQCVSAAFWSVSSMSMAYLLIAINSGWKTLNDSKAMKEGA